MPTAYRHAVFHSLRVASVDRLTEDSVAITFDVPDELREEFRFNAGQHLSVRAAGLGEDVRRNYSICDRRAAADRGEAHPGGSVLRLRGRTASGR
jgi:ring-1,2-phenylacetyl-CoA epoxidase subunit PaaE